MEEPIIPINEEERLEGLHRIKILDTPAEENFDRITRLAKKIMDVPIAIISPADHQVVDFVPLTLSWQLQASTSTYLIEFLEEGEEEPVFSAYTRQANYTIPAHTLEGLFGKDNRYVWKVKAIAEDASIVNESLRHHFTFR